MKRILLLLILIGSALITKAQRATYADLKYVLYHNVDEVQDYLLQKGFTFGGIDTIGDSREEIDYHFTKNSSNSLNYISVSKKSINEIFYEVSFFTLKQEDYIRLKQSVKSLGYKLTSTSVNKGTLISNFVKGNLGIDFWTTRNNEDNVTNYYISLTDLKRKSEAFSN